MQSPKRLPYGSWPSPISAHSLVEGVSTVTDIFVDGEDVWWSESRPDEGGRIAIMLHPKDGRPHEVTPPDANVRSRVHEYGGGAWFVADAFLYYVEFRDQRIRRISPEGKIKALTPEPPENQSWRFADGRIMPDGASIVCIREVHFHLDDGVVVEPDNQIVSIATDGSFEIRELVVGADFYAFPRPSPDAEFLAWVQWLHPSMPWFGTELWVGRLEDGDVTNAKKVEGGIDESILQPEWSHDTTLFFLSDRTGWSNLYRFSPEGSVLECGGDFDIAGPLWTLGQSRYAITDTKEIFLAARNTQGDLLISNVKNTVVNSSATIHTVRSSSSGSPIILASTHQTGPTIIRAAPQKEIIHHPKSHGLSDEFLPTPAIHAFPTSDGGEAYALFYPPAHPEYAGIDDETPPLLVLAHGGPTGSARNELQLGLRYWTSRGWAVADINYRGSTGFGRSYMEELDGEWGIKDVQDCVDAAEYFVAEALADPNRLAIKGGSAGGFTVLAALAFHSTFSAGASRYGVADLETLALDTHKFESRYLDRLIGPYPDERNTYVERSPIHHSEKFTCPMIILQGTDDAVVPQNQADHIVSALKEKNIPYSYLLFDGEGHGFRKAENIVAALEAEYSFFSQIFGFRTADDINKVSIVRGS